MTPDIIHALRVEILEPLLWAAAGLVVLWRIFK